MKLYTGTNAAAALVLVAFSGHVDATCSGNLLYTELETDAKCADGTQAGYFHEDGISSANVVMYFGDGPICGSAAECGELCDPELECTGVENIPESLSKLNISETNLYNADATLNETTLECFEAKVRCGSSFWGNSTLTPASILCKDDEYFGSFSRYYIPHCSLDWWMGVGSTTGKFTFNGVTIVQQVLAKLPVGLEKLVLVASGGAGAGVLNILDLIQGILPTVQILTVLDSSWKSEFRTLDSFFTQRRRQEISRPILTAREIQFSLQSTLSKSSQAWLSTANLNTGCKNNYLSSAQFNSTGLESCLLTSNLLTNYIQDDPVFVIQSQYDLKSMKDLGLGDADIRSIRDTLVTEADQDRESVVAVTINSFVESYGRTQRVSMDRLKSVVTGTLGTAPKHNFFVPACGHHQYLPPTNLHVLPATTLLYGDTAKLVVSRPSDLWSQVSAGGDNLKSRLTAWVSNHTGAEFQLSMDRCGSFLCNTKCPTQVESFRLQLSGPESLTSECEQLSNMAYAYLIAIIVFVTFAIALIRVGAFRRTCSLYWQENGNGLLKSNRELVQQQLVEEVAADKSREIQLMVRDLSYWVTRKTGSRNIFGRKTESVQIQILRNVSLNFTPGNVHALMGPSGSGKSTLLDLLSLNRESGMISGRHYINGVPSAIERASFLRTWLQNNLSYVRQQDVLFPNLTVRQHLEHSAWLMLPEFMPSRAKLQRVSQVVKLLELEDCVNTICGDGGVKIQGGISGGQRRRVSVATQLLRMPAALLLDEPTTGLDSTNALLLVKSLHTLAHRGRVSVIMTLHQPRREIYDLLDVLSILHRGRVVYSGPPQREAIEHFGLAPDEHNISDEILDILSAMPDSEVEQIQQNYLRGPLGQEIEQQMNNEQTFLTDTMAIKLQDILVNNALAEGRWSWTEVCSVTTLAWVLMSRTFARGGFDLHRTVLLSGVGGLIVGLVFVENQSYTGFASLLYLGVSTMTFLQGTFLGDRYNAEKRMYDYEKENGTKISMWALLVSQLLRNGVSSIAEGSAFAIPVYFLGGLQPSRFQEYFLIMILTSFVCIAQSTLVEILLWRKKNLFVASVSNMGLLSLNALFNGFIVRLNDIPVYFSWLPYAMMSYWSFSGVLVNQFAGFSLPCAKAGALECAVRTGDNLIRSFEFDNQDPYKAMWALMVFLAVIHILSAIAFYVLNELGQRGRLKVNREAEKIRRQRQAQSPAKQAKGTGQTMQTVLDNVAPDSPKHAGFQSSPGTSARGYNNGTLPRVEGDDRVNAIVNNNQGRLVTFLLSRQTLMALFFLDLATALYVCAFASVGLVSQDLMIDFSTVNFDLSGTEALFVAGNLLVLGIYGLQFLFQLFFMVPRNDDGSRLGFIWFSWWDLCGLALLVGDAITTIVLVTLREVSVENQVGVVLFIRVLRLLRVVTFWRKVSTFHQVRANVYRSARASGTFRSDSNSSAAGIDPILSDVGGNATGKFHVSNMNYRGGNRNSGHHRGNQLRGMFQQQGIRTSRAVWQDSIFDEV